MSVIDLFIIFPDNKANKIEIKRVHCDCNMNGNCCQVPKHESTSLFLTILISKYDYISSRIKEIKKNGGKVKEKYIS